MITKSMEEAFLEGMHDVWGDDPPPWGATQMKATRKRIKRIVIIDGKPKKKHKKAKKPKSIKIGEITHDP